MPLNTEINIVSVDDAMEEIGAPDTALYRIERLINAISRRIERYTNSRFKKRTLTLTLNGGEFALLDLGSPIISITSVTVGGTLLAATDYDVLKARGQLLRVGGWTDPVADGRAGINNVVVVGVFGYDPIPDDIIEAFYMILRERFGRSGSEGLRSERIGDYSYDKFGPEVGGVDVGASDIIVEARSILDMYTRHVV